MPTPIWLCYDSFGLTVTEPEHPESADLPEQALTDQLEKELHSCCM